VPVITCPGATFAGRHSTSHLTNAGCGQFVAADFTQYVELAVDWASRLDELAELRRTLRGQVQRSPLCDGPGFARDLLALIQEHWLAQTRD
jgi:predicted O-linked N-acetylglucosamine transferase (SPINDLY family)